MQSLAFVLDLKCEFGFFEQSLPLSRLRGAVETMVVARGDDVAAIAIELDFVFDVGIKCAALFVTSD